MKCLVIYSPFSKKGKFIKYKSTILSVLKDNYSQIDFVQTKHSGHATEIAKNSKGYDMLLVAGGDGLLNEVVSGIVELNIVPKIAFLPSGTVNDSARSLKIPMNLKGALKVAVKGIPFKTDIIKYNENYCFYVLLLGYCAKSVYTTSNIAKRFLGWFAYFFKGIKSFFSHNRMHLKIKIENEQEIEDYYSFVLMFNSHSVAGFPVNKDAILDDGYIDLIMVKDYGKGVINWFKNTLNVLRLFVLGIEKLKQNKFVTIKKVKNVDITNYDNNPFNVDGNYGGDGNIQLSVLKQAVEIMVNKKK